MSVNSLPINKIDRHLNLLGLQNCGIQSLFAKWIKCNGPHWTVKRIKSLKIQLISIIAGNNFDKNWIAYKGSYPRGPFKPLFKGP
jgi:hypothetical protein